MAPLPARSRVSPLAILAVALPTIALFKGLFYAPADDAFVLTSSPAAAAGRDSSAVARAGMMKPEEVPYRKGFEPPMGDSIRGQKLYRQPPNPNPKYWGKKLSDSFAKEAYQFNETEMKWLKCDTEYEECYSVCRRYKVGFRAGRRIADCKYDCWRVRRSCYWAARPEEQKWRKPR
eukprot:TRINITY_DN3518_c0_g1_i2.p1 TRINITY_DN3518_c0_g1~~TRINITY_DN3518_c0_g1_i2.p1  ORF type:complete len:176 (-),score=48.77 TRINITY_DN3518_c0_g1_i2:125-652(-)